MLFEGLYEKVQSCFMDWLPAESVYTTLIETEQEVIHIEPQEQNESLPKVHNFNNQF